MSHNVLKKLGQNIKRLRLAKDLSQEKLAELSNLHRTYVGGVERGERNISLLNLTRLAQALEVSLADLMEGIDS
jgi:transcriptional regulator with XRE-family HTH domain